MCLGSLQKKTILIVMPELFWGGAETQFRTLIEGLNKDKYDVEVLIEHSRRGSSSKDSEFIADNSNNIKFHELRDKRERKTCLKLKDLLLFFGRRNREYDLTIIYGGLSFLFIPLIKACGNIVCYSERNAGWASVRQNIKDLFSNSADVIVCNSKPAYEKRKETHRRVQFIPNATQVFPEQGVSGYASCNILLISRIARVKNIECAIHALEFLPNNLTITLIGAPEETLYERELHDLSKSLGMEGRFVFKGFSHDISHDFENSFCTILTSFEEGMPNAILESWAHGRIAVASDIPANAALIKDAELRFPCNEPKELANRIMRLKSMPQKDYDALCLEYKQLAEQCYSVGAMLDRYEGLVDSLV